MSDSYKNNLLGPNNKGMNTFGAVMYVFEFLCLYVLLTFSDETKAYICHAFALLVSALAFMFKNSIPKQCSFLPLFIFTLASWANMFEISRVFNMTGITGDFVDWIRLSMLALVVYHSYRSLVSLDEDMEYDEWIISRKIIIAVMALNYLKEVIFLGTYYSKISEGIFCEWIYCVIFSSLFLGIHIFMTMPGTVFINSTKFWKCGTVYMIVAGLLIGFILVRDEWAVAKSSKYVVAMWLAFILIMTFIAFLIISFVIKPALILLKRLCSNPFWIEDDYKHISDMCEELRNRDLPEEYRKHSLFYSIYDLEELADIQQELVEIMEIRMQILKKERLSPSDEMIEIMMFIEKSLITQVNTDYHILLR